MWKKRGGIEIEYRLLCPESARHQSSCADVLRRRFEMAEFKYVQVSASGPDRLLLRLVEEKPERIELFRELARRVGRVEFFRVADKATHEAWSKDWSGGSAPPEPPVGFLVLPNDKPMSGEYGYLSREYLLVGREPVLVSSDIRMAVAEDSKFDQRWVVSVKFTDDGERRIDSATQELYRQTPRGLIAVVIDGVILSKPTIQSEKLGGQASISGRWGRQEAEAFAIVIRSGYLPCTLGTLEKGNPMPGRPVAERMVPPSGK